MADIPTDLAERKQREIIDTIQSFEHHVATKAEIQNSIDKEVIDVGKKQFKRYLDYLVTEGVLESRKVGNTNVWWIAPDKIPPDESVATAQQVLNLLKRLYNQRREFRVMAWALLGLHTVFSITLWVGILRLVGFTIASTTTILAGILVTIVGLLLVIIGALFIFPVETYGSWPRAIKEGTDDHDQ